MTHKNNLHRELSNLFGEDAVLMNQTYLQTMQVLHAMALAASEQNASRARSGTPALAQVYVGEAQVFSDVAQELRRATTRITDILDGVTPSSCATKGANRCNS